MQLHHRVGRRIQVSSIQLGLEELGRQCLASQVMARQTFQDLALPDPVLKHQRRHLHEVHLDGGTRE